MGSHVDTTGEVVVAEVVVASDAGALGVPTDPTVAISDVVGLNNKRSTYRIVSSQSGIFPAWHEN